MASRALERVRSRVEQEQATARASNGKVFKPLTSAAVVVGGASGALTLIGYGAARANDALFGLSYALWYDSPLDLITMSGDSVIGLVHASATGFGGWEMWRDAGVTSVLVAFMVLVMLTGQWLRTSTQAQPWRERCLNRLERAAIWLFTPRDRFSAHVAHASVTAAAAGLIGGLSLITGLLLLGVLLSVVSILSVIGFVGASTYAKASIIEPPSCISPIGVRLRAVTKTIGAPCVEVTEPSTGKTVVGRLILARGSRVFLYSKEEDRAFMFTTKDASMATVHRLPPATRVGSLPNDNQVQQRKPSSMATATE